MYWWLKSPWRYFIPRFDRNYEVVDGKVVHGKEAINIGQYYGLFYFDLRSVVAVRRSTVPDADADADRPDCATAGSAGTTAVGSARQEAWTAISYPVGVGQDDP
jgi:hypothetical protein